MPSLPEPSAEVTTTSQAQLSFRTRKFRTATVTRSSTTGAAAPRRSTDTCS